MIIYGTKKRNGHGNSKNHPVYPQFKCQSYGACFEFLDRREKTGTYDRGRFNYNGYPGPTSYTHVHTYTHALESLIN